ncbi:MAG: hypothetical protein E7028_09400, partial [Planctomycetaceae bacterium]|nr:hypothetical protein [Planctomycetaceae bacterium]
MKRVSCFAFTFFFLGVLAILGSSHASLVSAQDFHLRLWPGLPPGESVSEEKIKAVRNVTCPMIDVFLPE